MKSPLLKPAISLICLALLCPTGPGQNTCAEEQRQAAALGAVRAQSHSDLPLEATLLPSLTDDVISLETKALPRALGAEVLIVSFYKLVPSTYQLEGSKIVGETVELDNYKEWLVAVSRRNDVIYLLEGSTDPVSEFNRFARDLHLQVADPNAALGIFDFFLKAARGQQFRSHVVADEMKLESVALEDFRLRFPTSKRKAAFNSWWASVSDGTKKTLSPPKANPVKNGFEVRYFFYDLGNISSQTLTISTDGTVTEGKSKIIVSGNPGLIK
jgi:hypothetical protein